MPHSSSSSEEEDTAAEALAAMQGASHAQAQEEGQQEQLRQKAVGGGDGSGAGAGGGSGPVVERQGLCAPQEGGGDTGGGMAQGGAKQQHPAAGAAHAKAPNRASRTGSFPAAPAPPAGLMMGQQQPTGNAGLGGAVGDMAGGSNGSGAEGVAGSGSGSEQRGSAGGAGLGRAGAAGGTAAAAGPEVRHLSFPGLLHTDSSGGGVGGGEGEEGGPHGGGTATNSGAAPAGQLPHVSLTNTTSSFPLPREALESQMRTSEMLLQAHMRANPHDPSIPELLAQLLKTQELFYQSMGQAPPSAAQPQPAPEQQVQP